MKKNKFFKLSFILFLFTLLSFESKSLAQAGVLSGTWEGQVDGSSVIMNITQPGTGSDPIEKSAFYWDAQGAISTQSAYPTEYLGYGSPTLDKNFSAVFVAASNLKTNSSYVRVFGMNARVTMIGEVSISNGDLVLEFLLTGVEATEGRKFSYTVVLKRTNRSRRNSTPINSLAKANSKKDIYEYTELNSSNLLLVDGNTTRYIENDYNGTSQRIFTALSTPLQTVNSITTQNSIGISFNNNEYNTLALNLSGDNGGNYFKGVKITAHSTTYGNRYACVKTAGISFNKTSGYTDIAYDAYPLPFTNNGASNWVSDISFGFSQTSQVLKTNFDSGGHFIWVNSTQCLVNPTCTGNGHTQFDNTKSQTFKWVNQVPTTIDWGPWGSSKANVGSDGIRFDNTLLNLTFDNFYLITSFDNTPQFNEFLWDAAIALPSRVQGAPQNISNFMTNLLNDDIISPGRVAVTMYFDKNTNSGKITIGSKVDLSQVDESSKIVFPFAYGPTYGGALNYLWTTPLATFKIGTQEFIDHSIKNYYCFDSGSSALKGDSVQLTNALAYAEQNNYPDMFFQMGKDVKGNPGQFVLTKNEYVKKIDLGERAGENVAQIQTLEGTPGLYLQGSTMLENVYTVYWFNVDLDITTGKMVPYGTEVWMFNKKNGPNIIQVQQ